MTDAEFELRENELRAEIARVIDEVAERRARRFGEAALLRSATLFAAATVIYGLFG